MIKSLYNLVVVWDLFVWGMFSDIKALRFSINHHICFSPVGRDI